MQFNPTARMSTIGNGNVGGVGASMQSYQPTAAGQVPSTLNPVTTQAEGGTNNNAPAQQNRRRRPGDSPKEETPSLLQ